jgi:hypothetical protein
VKASKFYTGRQKRIAPNRSAVCCLSERRSRQLFSRRQQAVILFRRKQSSEAKSRRAEATAPHAELSESSLSGQSLKTHAKAKTSAEELRKGKRTKRRAALSGDIETVFRDAA